MTVKQAVLRLGVGLGLPALARRATASHLRILAYHGAWVTPGPSYGGCTFIDPDQFERRMSRLKGSGLPVLPLGEAVDRLADGTLPKAAVAITIDDGWVSTFTHMLPVLERYELPATLYATTWYAQSGLPVVNVAVDYLVTASGRADLDSTQLAAKIEALPAGDRLDALRQVGSDLGVGEAWLEQRQFHLMSAEELAQAHRRGLDIQLHTHRHIDVEAGIGRLANEVAQNRDFLRLAVGEAPLDHFCYPSGSFHEDAPQVLRESGVRSATLVEEGINPTGCDPYRLRRLLDGPLVSDVEFDAYLSGMLHYLAPAKALLRR